MKGKNLTTPKYGTIFQFCRDPMQTVRSMVQQQQHQLWASSCELLSSGSADDLLGQGWHFSGSISNLE